MKKKIKTFKSEYIEGVSVKVEMLREGFKLTYGNGHVYRLAGHDARQLFDHLDNHMSVYYVDKIVNHFLGEVSI